MLRLQKLFQLIITSNYQGQASFEAFEAFVAPMLSWSLKSGYTDYFWIKILSTNLKNKPALKLQINILLKLGLGHYHIILCGTVSHIKYKYQYFAELLDYPRWVWNSGKTYSYYTWRILYFHLQYKEKFLRGCAIFSEIFLIFMRTCTVFTVVYILYLTSWNLSAEQWRRHGGTQCNSVLLIIFL